MKALSVNAENLPIDSPIGNEYCATAKNLVAAT